MAWAAQWNHALPPRSRARPAPAASEPPHAPASGSLLGPEGGGRLRPSMKHLTEQNRPGRTTATRELCPPAQVAPSLPLAAPHGGSIRTLLPSGSETAPWAGSLMRVLPRAKGKVCG